MSALRRSIAKLRSDVDALRRHRGDDWRVERVVGDSWLTSGWTVWSPAGVGIFVHDEAPSSDAWETAFVHLRHRASPHPPADQSPGAGNVNVGVSVG